MTTLPMHPKKKLDIVIEAPARARLLALLDQGGASGYTVTPAIAGRGREGAWQEGELSSAGTMIVVTCVVDAAKLDQVLASVYALVTKQIGMVTVTDVFVVRNERF